MIKRCKILMKCGINYQITHKQFYKQCLQVIPDGVCILNSQYDILFHNQQLEKLMECEQSMLAFNLLNLQISEKWGPMYIQNQKFNIMPVNNNNFNTLSVIPEAKQKSSLTISKQSPQQVTKFEINIQNCTVLSEVLDELTKLQNQDNQHDKFQKKQSIISNYAKNNNNNNNRGSDQNLIEQELFPQIKEILIQNSLKINQKNSNLQVMKALQNSLKNSNEKLQKQFQDVIMLKVNYLNQQFLVRVIKISLNALDVQVVKQDIILLVVQDISNDQLVQKLTFENEQSKKQLAQTSHEFRTPLNCAIAMLERLSSLISKDLISDYLDPALNSIKLLLSLINDILDYSQINAGKFSFSFQRFKIRKTISQAIQLIKIQAELKSIKLDIDIDKQIPQFITSDPNRLRQILLNLLSNSLKFTKKGSITTKVSVFKETPLTLQFQIIDTGIGIKKENQEKLFQCFGKVNDKENKKMNAHGVGLGLIISNSLVRGLGAEDSTGLTVESVYGQGTTFSFLIVDKEDKDLLQLEIESDENVINSSMSDIKVFEQKKFNSPKNMDIQQSQKYLITEPQQSDKKNKKKYKKQISNNFLLSDTKNNQQDYLYNYENNFDNNMIRSQSNSISSQQQKQCLMQSLSSEMIINNLQKKYLKVCNCKKVMVIDDNQFNILIFQRTFSNFLPNIDTASSGNDAIEKVKLKLHEECCKHYNIIFMDIEMPEKNGYETSSEINKILQNHGIFKYIIIACSGYNEDDDVKKQMNENGMLYYLQKPVEKKQLKNLLIKIYSESDKY